MLMICVANYSVVTIVEKGTWTSLRTVWIRYDICRVQAIAAFQHQGSRFEGLCMCWQLESISISGPQGADFIQVLLPICLILEQDNTHELQSHYRILPLSSS